MAWRDSLPAGTGVLIESCLLVVRKREDEHRTLAGADDILLAIDRVADGAARVRAAKVDVPQQLASGCVERDERAVHASAEDEVTRSREHARLGVVDHLEVPLFFAGLCIQRANRAVAFF